MFYNIHCRMWDEQVAPGGFLSCRMGPSIRQSPGVRLCDLDDLQATTQANMMARQRQLERCEAIIQEHVSHFLRRQVTSTTAFGDVSVAAPLEIDPQPDERPRP